MPREITGPYEVTTVQLGSVAEKVVAQAARNSLSVKGPRILGKPYGKIGLSGPDVFAEEFSNVIEVSSFLIPEVAVLSARCSSRPVTLGVGVVEFFGLAMLKFSSLFVTVPRPPG